MMRLSTYFSLLATLLCVFCGSVICFIAVMVFRADLLVFLALFPVAVASFILSLIISHFLTQPIRDLIRKIELSMRGDTTVDFAPTEVLYETDRLSALYGDVLAKSTTQTNELALREKRQNDFISDVAHELRTPLTAIHGNAELMLDPDMPQDMRERFCTTIINESDRLGRLTNDLITLKHVEEASPSELKRLDLKKLVTEVVDTLHPLFEEHGVTVDIEGEAPDVLGNRDRLKQVVSNLLDNANRHVEQGGHICVQLAGIDDKSIMAVRDNGCGFGSVNPDLLFDRFYRADYSRDRKIGGSGLGLSIVKSIVESHDGVVSAVNLPEGGACFIVALPSIPSKSH